MDHDKNTNVISLDQKRQEKADQNAFQLSLVEREAADAKKPNYALRRLGAGVLVALSALGVVKAGEIAAGQGPKAVAAVENVIGNAVNGPELDGSVPVTVEKGDTLYEIAEEAAPSVDPRLVVHALEEKGVTPDSIQPGETISVPIPLSDAHK